MQIAQTVFDESSRFVGKRLFKGKKKRLSPLLIIIYMKFMGF